MDTGSSLQNRVPRKRRKMQRVTMMDVAKLAQVSPSTVSLYLRKPAAVSPAAGQEIARAISTLGYVPNLVAGGLAAASSKVVSVIVPSIRNAFFAETVSTLQSELAAEGLQVILGHSEYGEDQEEALVRTALAWAPAAVVLTGLSHSAETRKLLQASGVPVIEMWEIGGKPVDMAVGFSHPQVGASAARHLLSKGRRSIAFLGARMQEDHRAAKRASGFAEEAKRDAGQAACEIINHPGAATVEAGSLLLSRALQQVPNLDGIACSNDLIALRMPATRDRRARQDCGCRLRRSRFQRLVHSLPHDDPPFRRPDRERSRTPDSRRHPWRAPCRRRTHHRHGSRSDRAAEHLSRPVSSL
ncbi:MAG: LacI family transcriptional regulator, partial [Microvirga sp.]|nr:LacI family transcriptional regulator [Microvirga sp.]